MPRMHGSNRRPRCSYHEGKRQCTRDGEGNPPICAAHRITLSEVGRTRPPGERILNLIENVLSGRRITEQQVAGALGDVAAWAIGGGMAAGYYPNMGGPRPEDFTPGGRRPPPPPPPEDDEDTQRQRRARQVLGFAPGDVLTKAVLENRRRFLARKWHPDLFPEGPKREAAQERMTQINQAVEVLLESVGD